MILPLGSAARGRSLRRFAGAILVVVLGVGLAPAARAQSDDPYSETVKVDATAETVVKARDKARLDGQRRALTAMVERLAAGTATAGGPAPKVKMPRLDDRAITDMVTSFEVANERMSAVRYIADYTFHFRPADVQRVLRGAGVNTAEEGGTAAAGDAIAGGKMAVLLPVYQIGTKAVLWDDPNPWREAWAQRKAVAGPTRLQLPLGDLSDIAAIDADKALAGDNDALAEIAKKNGSDETLVVLAAVRGPSASPAGLDIAVRRYRAGQFVDVHTLLLDANPGEAPADFLRRAVDAVASAVDSGWKSTPGQYDQQGKITVAAAIGGLDDWLKLRDRLSGVPAIRKIDLKSLSRQEAVVDIAYIGNVDQLTASLAAIGLELSRGDPMWHITGSAAAAK